jgi:hypothetical protein
MYFNENNILGERKPVKLSYFRYQICWKVQSRVGTWLLAGRSRFKSRWGGFFQLTESFQPHYGPGVDSASNRNQYQEYSWGVKGVRSVRLTALPPSVSRLSRANVWASTSHNPMGHHGLLQGWLYLFLSERSLITRIDNNNRQRSWIRRYFYRYLYIFMA